MGPRRQGCIHRGLISEVDGIGGSRGHHSDEDRVNVLVLQPPVVRVDQNPVVEAVHRHVVAVVLRSIGEEKGVEGLVAPCALIVGEPVCHDGDEGLSGERLGLQVTRLGSPHEESRRVEGGRGEAPSHLPVVWGVEAPF